MHLRPHRPVVVKTFRKVRTTQNSSIRTCDAQHSSLTHRSDRSIKKRNHRSIRVKIDYIKSPIFCRISQQCIRVLQTESVFISIKLIQLKVILHQFVSSWKDIISHNLLHSLQFFNVPNCAQTTCR